MLSFVLGTSPAPAWNGREKTTKGTSLLRQFFFMTNLFKCDWNLEAQHVNRLLHLPLGFLGKMQ